MLGVIRSFSLIVISIFTRKLNLSFFRTIIRLGEHDLASKEDCVGGVQPGLEYCSDPPLDIEIEEKIVHEDYNPEDINTHGDIALLRLKQEVAYTGKYQL